MQQLERSIGLKDLALADLEQKVRDMEAATFDGVLVWKIPGFARKRQEAVAGRTPAIFSPGTGCAAPPSRRRAGAHVLRGLEPAQRAPGVAPPPQEGGGSKRFQAQGPRPPPSLRGHQEGRTPHASLGGLLAVSHAPSVHHQLWGSHCPVWRALWREACGVHAPARLVPAWASPTGWPWRW